MKASFVRVKRRDALLGLFLIATGTSAASDASPAAMLTTMHWGPCAAELVDPRWSAVLGERLECGTMPAWIDADAPEQGALTVGLVRFKAGEAAQRQGSIFFNFGGPGGNPLDFMPSIGYLWSTRSANHPLDGDKRRLADRYDLIAVIPRGLRGGTRFTCRVPESEDGHDPTVDLADWNWVAHVKESRAYAAGCAADPLHAHVGTLQHVRDMEQARVALHEPVLHFLGVSYGTWVGAFYAEMYPAHAGRIVLDSAMNHAGTFEDQVADEPYERQALFSQTALRPALAAPAVYGLGTDAGTVLERLRTMPHRAQEAWPSLIDSPEDLVAALVMADWVKEDGEGKTERLMARMNGYRFSNDDVVDGKIHDAARAFAPLIERGRMNDPQTAALVDSSVYHAVVCGDTPWLKDAEALRNMANDIGARYRAASGAAVTLGLTCLHWPSPSRWRPPLSALAGAPPMLMVQAEFDPATPASGAIRAFNASPNAYMILARGMTGHGVFGSSATPCIERGVGRFLLRGELPSQRTSGCDFVPTPASRYVRDSGQPMDEQAVRDELQRRLRTM
jgi:pimeloyl-ACP methyl ester carboxylesterase